MPENKQRDPNHNFIDFFEMSSVPFWDEIPIEGQITIIELPRQKFYKRTKKIILNEFKEHAEDVEFEEI